MNTRWALAAAVVMSAALTACGGGGDDDFADDPSNLGLDGTYVVGCYPVLGGATPVSGRTYLDIRRDAVTSTDYYFAGSTCQGDAFAGVTYLTGRLTPHGTKPVAGPNGAGAVTALRVVVSTFGEPVRVSGSVRQTASGANFEVLYPNSTLVVESYASVQSNFDSPDLLAIVGDALYFGNDAAPIASDGYPSALDYSAAWFWR